MLPGIDPNTSQSYKPLKGTLYETGVKYAPSFLDGYINLALFDLEQTNSLVSTGSGQQTQAGEVTSQGIELEGRAGYRALRLTAAYTYTDAKTNDTGKGDRRASLIRATRPPSGATTRCSRVRSPVWNWVAACATSAPASASVP